MQLNAAAATCMAAASANNIDIGVDGRKGSITGAKTKRCLPCNWYVEYLVDNSIYSLSDFRKVFRVPLRLYFAIHNRIVM